jgi:integrase
MQKNQRIPGTGNIEKLASGRYRYRLRLADGKRISSEPFISYEECEHMLELFLSVNAQKMSNSKALTLEVFGNQWLEGKTHKSIETDRSFWRTHLEKSSLAKIPLYKITRSEMKQFLQALSQKKALVFTAGNKKKEAAHCLSRQTQQHVLNLLRRILNDAHDEDLIEKNPAVGLRILKNTILKTRVESFLSIEQIETVLSAPSIPLKKRLVFQFAIYSGLRQGEIWGLRWEDVEFFPDHIRLTIRRSYNGTTKSDKVYSMTLLPGAEQVLRTLKRLEPYSTGLIFPSPDGGMYAKKFDGGWRKYYRDALGLGHVRFHDFRHTCVSHLLMGSWGRVWSLKEACDYVGHSSIAITQRYAHLCPEHLHKNAMNTNRGPQVLAHIWPTPDFTKRLSAMMEKRGFEPLTPSVQSPKSTESNQTLTSKRGPDVGLHGPSRTVFLFQNVFTKILKKEKIPIDLLRTLTQEACDKPDQSLIQIVTNLSSAGNVCAQDKKIASAPHERAHSPGHVFHLLRGNPNDQEIV